MMAPEEEVRKQKKKELIFCESLPSACFLSLLKPVRERERERESTTKEIKFPLSGFSLQEGKEWLHFSDGDRSEGEPHRDILERKKESSAIKTEQK